jgi:hypothetical protein
MKRGFIVLLIIGIFSFPARLSIGMEIFIDYRFYWAVNENDYSYHSLRLDLFPLSIGKFGISFKPLVCIGTEYNRNKSSFERIYGGLGISAGFLDYFNGGIELHAAKYDFNITSKRQDEMARVIGENWETEGEAFLKVEYPLFRFMKSQILGYAMDTFNYNFTENLGAMNRVESGMILRILKRINIKAGWRHEDILGGGPDADQIFIGLSF